MSTDLDRVLAAISASEKRQAIARKESEARQVDAIQASEDRLMSHIVPLNTAIHGTDNASGMAGRLTAVEGRVGVLSKGAWVLFISFVGLIAEAILRVLSKLGAIR